MIGSAAGSLLMHWQMSKPDALIFRVQRLDRDIHSRIETLAMFIDLTPAQENRLDRVRKRLIGPREGLVDLDELFEYYEWASKHSCHKRGHDPVVNAWLGPTRKRKTLDPIALAALAIICEKLLGLTRVHALSAMLRARRAEDYKEFFTSKEPLNS